MLMITRPILHDLTFASGDIIKLPGLERSFLIKCRNFTSVLTLLPSVIA